VQGRVTRIEPFGVFVAFGHGMEGFVHVSNLSHDRVEDPGSMVKLGDTLDLRVLYVKKGGKRIGLGLKQMTQSPWEEIERHCYVDQIVEGTVTRVVEFGAFVKIRDGIEGLLHDSETGRAKDRPLRSVLAPGQRLSLRIQDIDRDAHRMSLSLMHRNGARITPEEAANAKTFAELVRESPSERLRVNIGALLLRALTASQPRDEGDGEQKLVS
jgi:small subunit ribosomal protein S1